MSTKYIYNTIQAYYNDLFKFRTVGNTDGVNGTPRMAGMGRLQSDFNAPNTWTTNDTFIPTETMTRYHQILQENIDRLLADQDKDKFRGLWNPLVNGLVDPLAPIAEAPSISLDTIDLTGGR